MNFTKITLSVALIGALTLAMADDTTQTNDTADTTQTTQTTDDTTQTTTVDTQIKQIQNASAQKRVELMNEFKQQLANMNKEDRAAAIAQLQEKMQTNMQNVQDVATATHDKAKNLADQVVEMGDTTHQRAQEMTQGKQAEAMQHINQMQQMNQMQAGDQMKHMMDQGGAATQNNNFRH